MEKDIGYGFRQQQYDPQLPNLNILSGPFNLGQQNTSPGYVTPWATVVSANGNLPNFLGIPCSKISELDEPHSWFHCLPCFREALTPVPNTVLEEKIAFLENREKFITPNKASECAQKRFLVFDQSSDQPTLMFGSGIGNPVQCPTSFGPKLNSAYDLIKVELGNGRNNIHYPRPMMIGGRYEDVREDVGSDSHEDTEEINALLYSSGDDQYSEDDEEGSTGHSPSTMTTDDKKEWFDKTAEEVASSAGPTKRMKVFDLGYDVPSLMDTACSVGSKRCFDYEDDAESSCPDGDIHCLGESTSLSGNKRSRTNKVRETVSILQNMIPDGKNKNAIVILDEAIEYLRSLKRKAEALGIYTL